MMILNPKISIVIPAYNVEKYIARCLESCIKQTLKEIEIIVVDDKGNDRSIEIVKEYATKDSRVKIVDNIKNLGTFHARVNGVKNATSEYLMFVDADDYIELNTCEILYKKALEDKSVDMVFFGMKREPKSIFRSDVKTFIEPLDGENILKETFIKCQNKQFSVCCRLYKKSLVVNSCNLIEKHINKSKKLISSEDGLMFFYFCVLAKKSIGIKDKFYVYCESTSSVTRKIDHRTIQVRISSIEDVIKEYEKLDSDTNFTNHKYFLESKKRVINQLHSVIDFEKRYSSGCVGYIFYCIISLKYFCRWQTFARIGICLATFGKKRL